MVGTKSGDTYTFRVNVSDHNNEKGFYVTHIYAYDTQGNAAKLTLDHVEVRNDTGNPVISDVVYSNVSASGYTIDEARTLTELENMTSDERETLVLPVEDVFKKYESVTLSDFFSRLAHAGQEIYLHKIGKSFPVGTVLRISDRDGFFAVGEVKEFDLGVAIKPIRQF
jgi:hypothetical protein